MLLTRKIESHAAAGPRLRRLAGVPLPTMDRRTFLKRSGLAAGAGAFASQLPFGAIGKAEAAAEGEAKKVEVKRTVELSNALFSLVRAKDNMIDALFRVHASRVNLARAQGQNNCAPGNPPKSHGWLCEDRERCVGPSSIRWVS